jgi:hypothetical protein
LGKCIVFHYQFNQPNHAQVNVTEELQWWHCTAQYLSNWNFKKSVPNAKKTLALFYVYGHR